MSLKVSPTCFVGQDLICIINVVSINLKYCHSFAFAGLLRQPKWGHLKDLHRAIKLCEPALVSGDATVIPLGNYQEVKLYLLFCMKHCLFRSIIGLSLISLLIYRLMYSIIRPEVVQHSLQITIRDHLQRCHLGICIITCLHGPSAFFQIARTLFTTLQGLEFLYKKKIEKFLVPVFYIILIATFVPKFTYRLELKVQG